MKYSIQTNVGTYEIDAAKISRPNLEAMSYGKAKHMCCNEVESRMLSWKKTHPKATDAEIRAEHVAAVERMIERMYNGNLTVKASPVRLTPVESELRELLQGEAKKRAKDANGTQLRGAALTRAVDWLREHDDATVAKLRKIAEQKVAGVDKIMRKASKADIANLMAPPKGKAA